MSSNIIVPNEEILEKPFPLPYERTDLSENDLKNFIENTINNNKIGIKNKRSKILPNILKKKLNPKTEITKIIIKG